MSKEACYQLDPTQDSRWTELVNRHAKASVFHTVAWLKALRRTYGYEPIVFTSCAPDETLRDGIVVCRVDSLLTGQRLVSLPFSDYCEPLFDSAPELVNVIRSMQAMQSQQKLKYLELRASESTWSGTLEKLGYVPADRYFLHRIDLRPHLDDLFRSFDRDSVQRRVQRAERAGLTERRGSSVDLLDDFYPLFAAMRRRHCLPPSPYTWFRNLIESQQNALDIRLAYLNQKPIAGIVTLEFRQTLYYKYGSSDPRFNKFAAIPWLFWRTICDAREKGTTSFDLGRTEPNHGGLLNFKNQWVSKPKEFYYLRYPQTAIRSRSGWLSKAAENIFSVMPLRLLELVGARLYRHFG
jgi:CelD/BcsL family acetyltransferase involved in cellulose biosynthesis